MTVLASRAAGAGQPFFKRVRLPIGLQTYTLGDEAGRGLDALRVGSGMLRWARNLPAAHRAGVRHFYVEQEPPFAIPRIEAARKSYAYLAQLRA